MKWLSKGLTDKKWFGNPGLEEHRLDTKNAKDFAMSYQWVEVMLHCVISFPEREGKK